MAKRETADLVIVGAGTVGGWASVFAREAGAGRVVVLESGLAGQGASSRAAGVVRAQAGTPATIELGRWSIEFYTRQRERYGTDSGFRELGYLLLAVTARDEREGRERVTMQRAAGLREVRWLEASEALLLNPTLSPDGHRGGSFLPTDGCVDPPRNVRAYSIAMERANVELLERTPFIGLRRSGGQHEGHIVGVDTPDGPIATERVLLTGGPTLRSVGRAAGVAIPVGAARHQVAVTEPHPAFEVERQPMVFDMGRGLYWRLEEGGLLFGMSNPAETPGPARTVDWTYLRKMQRRLARLVPDTAGLGLRKAWAATIEYTPDHRPILGPAASDGSAPQELTVASACGHGMMWGPAVARIAADLALGGSTDLMDWSEFGLDRFDEQGRSRAAPDPVALPFPASAGDE